MLSKPDPSSPAVSTRQATANSRMDAVQAPMVSVIAGLIRENPGTISLGQGVVHYGPPASATSAVLASSIAIGAASLIGNP